MSSVARSESEDALAVVGGVPSRKLYSNSWFYKNDENLYPTIEEQVEMCRRIASQLVDDENKRSRGAQMFYRRVRRAHKWVHPASLDSAAGRNTSLSTSTLTSTLPNEEDLPKVNKDPPRLKLILDPRGSTQTLDRIMQENRAASYCEHKTIPPSLCSKIVQDLNSPETNRGAKLFAKRRESSEKWVVDENAWKERARQYLTAALPLEKIESQTNVVTHSQTLPRRFVSNYSSSASRTTSDSSTLFPSHSSIAISSQVPHIPTTTASCLVPHSSSLSPIHSSASTSSTFYTATCRVSGHNPASYATSDRESRSDFWSFIPSGRSTTATTVAPTFLDENNAFESESTQMSSLLSTSVQAYAPSYSSQPTIAKYKSFNAVPKSWQQFKASMVWARLDN